MREPARHEHCEIVSDGNYAQVSWGKAFGGNDARAKVIFERADGGWIEILRYEAPTPTPARNRTNARNNVRCGRRIGRQAPGRRIGRFDVVMPPFST